MVDMPMGDPEVVVWTAEEDRDWDAIEREYRAGIKTVRELENEFGVPNNTIFTRAKAKGWKRDLTHKIARAKQKSLARDIKNQSREQEIIEYAAATQVSVIREHRGIIKDARTMVEELLTMLHARLLNGDEMREIARLLAVKEDPDTGESTPNKMQLNAYLKMLGLGEDADIMEKLIRSLERLVKLERTAFAIKDDEGEGENVSYEERLKMLAESGMVGTDSSGRVTSVIEGELEQDSTPVH
jgi:hypothetical protein